jgi:peptide/nickel transport system substrate-binding protein
VRLSRLTGSIFAAPMLLALAACGDKAPCARCDTLVIASVNEPSTLLPPLVRESVGRDISDQVFERLADFRTGASPLDEKAYRPALAERWEQVDSLSWRFHLRPGARWHDGRPVTSEDVRFSFEVFSDSLIQSAAYSYLAGRLEVLPEDSTSFVVRFSEFSPEALYDATYHVRIVPAHLWQAVPRDHWAADTSLARLVGSGPYRVARWERGQFVELRAESAGSGRAEIARVIWRFASDPDAALNLVLSHEADVLETAGSPQRAGRAAGDSALRVVPYPSAAYGFLGFNLAGQSRGQHPVLGDRETRRGLAMALDRAMLAQMAFGQAAKAPPGPMSQLLWIWSDSIPGLRFDRAEAERVLTEAGWIRNEGSGVRDRRGRPLAVDIMVPGTSPVRRQLAEAIQELWRGIGVKATVTTLDFAVFQERLAQGRFDSYIGTWLDEPSPRGLADQWTRAGWAAINYGRYANPRFDSLLARAGQESSVPEATRLYRDAIGLLNSDAPAVFLFAPSQSAVVATRLANVTIDPFSWASGLREWEIRAQ